MTRLLRSSLLYSTLFIGVIATAQTPEDRREIIKFGVGVKTLMTSDLLSVGEATFINEGVSFSYAPKLSFALDAVVRIKLKGRFSIQTGLTTLRRSYDFQIASDSLSHGDFIRQTGYQIPLTALLQVPISDRAKVGIEAGYVQDAFTTNIAKGNDSFLTYIFVNGRFKPALRTSAVFSQGLKDGSAIEFGFAYHRMLGRLGTIIMDYDPGSVQVTGRGDLSGHFFSLNIAFFFP